MTQSLQLIPQNKYISKAFMDIVNAEKEDDLDGDAIVMNTMRNAGLSFGDKADECI